MGTKKKTKTEDMFVCYDRYVCDFEGPMTMNALKFHVGERVEDGDTDPDRFEIHKVEASAAIRVEIHTPSPVVDIVMN